MNDPRLILNNTIKDKVIMIGLKVQNLTVKEIHEFAEKLREYGEYVKQLEDSKLITIVNAFYHLDPRTRSCEYVKYSHKCDDKEHVIETVKSIIQRSIDKETLYTNHLNEIGRKLADRKWWRRLLDVFFKIRL